MFTLSFEWNEMKYAWMNEPDSVFAKEGFLAEVWYVNPSFLGSLDVNSLIPRSHSIWMNDMKIVMCYMQYVCAMCKMLCVVCIMISMMMHVTLMAWLCKSKLGMFIHFPNPNLEKLTKTFRNHVVRKKMFLIMHVLGVSVLQKSSWCFWRCFQR